MSAEVKALIAAAEETEERCKRYSRVADMLDKLALALYIPALATSVAGLATYLLYNVQHVAVAGLALWATGYAAYILRNVYDYRAVRAARRACVFRRAAEIIVGIEKIKAKLEKETAKKNGVV